MAKVMQKLWGGVLEFETDDTPWDIRRFNNFGRSAILWLEQSRGLHRAARGVWAGSSVGDAFAKPIALMLGGYAIETLLKMVVVSDHCDLHGMVETSHRAEKFLPKTHDLRALVIRAKLRVNKMDCAVLSRLSPYAVWAGRYPIPLFAAGYTGPAVFDDLLASKAHGLGRLWLQYTPLYKKLHRLAVRKTFKEQSRAIKST